MRFRLALGLTLCSSSLSFWPTKDGNGNLWPCVGAGLFEKYSIFRASVHEQRFNGYIASSLSKSDNKSSLAAEKIDGNGIAGNSLN